MRRHGKTRSLSCRISILFDIPFRSYFFSQFYFAVERCSGMKVKLCTVHCSFHLLLSRDPRTVCSFVRLRRFLSRVVFVFCDNHISGMKGQFLSSRSSSRVLPGNRAHNMLNRAGSVKANFEYNELF